MKQACPTFRTKPVTIRSSASWGQTHQRDQWHRPEDIRARDTNSHRQSCMAKLTFRLVPEQKARNSQSCKERIYEKIFPRRTIEMTRLAAPFILPPRTRPRRGSATRIGKAFDTTRLSSGRRSHPHCSQFRPSWAQTLLMSSLWPLPRTFA